MQTISIVLLLVITPLYSFGNGAFASNIFDKGHMRKMQCRDYTKSSSELTMVCGDNYSTWNINIILGKAQSPFWSTSQNEDYAFVCKISLQSSMEMRESYALLESVIEETPHIVMYQPYAEKELAFYVKNENITAGCVLEKNSMAISAGSHTWTYNINIDSTLLHVSTADSSNRTCQCLPTEHKRFSQCHVNDRVLYVHGHSHAKFGRKSYLEKTFFPDALPPNYAVMVQKEINDAGDSIKLLHEDLMVWKQIIARYPNMHVGVEIDQESLAINVAAFLKDYSTGQQYFTNVGLLPQYPVFFSYYTSLGFYMYLGEGLYQQDPSLHKLHGIDSSQLRQMQEFAYRAEDNTLRGRSQISQEEAFETFLQKLDTLVNEYRGRLRTTSLDTIDQVSQTYEPRFKQLALTYPVGSVPNQVAQSYHVVLTMIEKTSLQRDVFMADYAFDLNEDMILSIGTFHKDGFERQLIKRCQSQ